MSRALLFSQYRQSRAEAVGFGQASEHFPGSYRQALTVQIFFELRLLNRDQFGIVAVDRFGLAQTGAIVALDLMPGDAEQPGFE